MAVVEPEQVRRGCDARHEGVDAREGAQVLSDPAGGARATIEVREATPADLDFIRALDAESLAYGIPHTRAATPAALHAAALDAYDDPDTRARLDAHYVTLVAERARTDGAAQPLGFIRLDFAAVEPSSGEAQCFIQQLAVSREAWGAGAAHALVTRAAAMSAARGLAYLVGVVTASNERTLRIALEALDFEVERYQIVKKCRE